MYALPGDSGSPPGALSEYYGSMSEFLNLLGIEIIFMKRRKMPRQGFNYVVLQLTTGDIYRKSRTRISRRREGLERWNRVRWKAAGKTVRMAPPTYEGDERLSNSECSYTSSYHPNREQYYAMATTNGNKHDGALESGEPYLSIAPLIAKIQ